MPDIDELYPPNPADVPDDLATPSREYRRQVRLILFCLIIFFVLFVGSILGSGFLTYYGARKCITGIIAAQKSPELFFFREQSALCKAPIWYGIGAFCSFLLFLFLVKCLFNGARRDESEMLEIEEEDEPKLFAFIEKVCEDTGAPSPKRIFVSPAVNACVFYNESFLSLFRPTSKNLLIGLGLVNRLNLVEFKAVIAHEFGHFSQKSMKLNAYVYTASRIIYDIVYGRGKLDRLVDEVNRADPFTALAASPIVGVIFLLRKLLEWLYRTTNFARSKLSKQMEFHADLVAVSVSGSDPLIYALAKLEFANQALEQAKKDLRAAADHKIYSRDLYYHHTQAMSYLRRVAGDSQLGDPPPLPKKNRAAFRIFEEEDESVPSMWETHPPSSQREANAKEIYIPSVLDERSPWLLFTDKAKLRERITRRVYKNTLKVNLSCALPNKNHQFSEFFAQNP